MQYAQNVRLERGYINLSRFIHGECKMCNKNPVWHIVRLKGSKDSTRICGECLKKIQDNCEFVATIK